jgi:hypothetical protein
MSNHRQILNQFPLSRETALTLAVFGLTAAFVTLMTLVGWALLHR